MNPATSLQPDVPHHFATQLTVSCRDLQSTDNLLSSVPQQYWGSDRDENNGWGGGGGGGAVGGGDKYSNPIALRGPGSCHELQCAYGTNRPA
jgi:hypothetical protein